MYEQKELGKKRFLDFINKEAPRYRPIMDNIPENDKIVEYSKQLYSISNKYRKKYNEYKKEFETISNTFHSFFDTK